MVSRLLKYSLTFFAGLCLLISNVSAQEIRKEKTLQPGKVFEACITMQSGDKLEYTFSTSTALWFNIHYHDDEKVIYAVPFGLTSSESAVFTSAESNSYCMMWKNTGPVSIELTLRYQLHRNNS